MDLSTEFCFCTLAIGHRYRTHAKLLAQDLQKYFPDTTLCILTDRPAEFKAFPHVLVFKHHPQSVKVYHDKRFVLKKALSLFECCMFLDSDVRVLGGIEKPMNWSPGITARTGGNLLKQIEKNKKKPNNSQAVKDYNLIEEAAQKLGIDPEPLNWFPEFMVVMKRQNGLEEDLFQAWQTISYFFEMKGIYDKECYSIALAAAKVGMTFDFCYEDKFPFFNDQIETIRIQQGQSRLQEKQIYFDIHREIEHPRYSLLKKIINKLVKQIAFYYRLLRLRIILKNDRDFINLFGKV